ncbi:MAG: hypothetical protein M5U34_01425 [Chloroflexi bacterium]|nr:hypothetical protein [Chloroflexota bacterium]
MLLVLDNLEHLLSPDLRTLISQLTAEAPDLRLIATSRERLHLQAETLLDLDGLPFPPKTVQPPRSTMPPFTCLATAPGEYSLLSNSKHRKRPLCDYVNWLAAYRSL